MPKLKHSFTSKSKHCLLQNNSFSDYDKAMLNQKTKKPPTDEQLALGKRIKEAIASKPRGIKRDIAKRCDIEPQSITGWISTGRVSKESLLIVSEETGYELNWLITGTGQKLKGDAPTEGQAIRRELTAGNIEPGPPDIASLMPLASPATQDILKTLEQGLADGKLSEADIKLLETIAKRLIDHDKSRKNR